MGGSITSAQMARMWGKSKRTFLRTPIVSRISENRYLARLGRHAEQLPWLDRDNFDLLAELRRNAVAVRDASTFMPADVLSAADRFAKQLRDRTDLVHSADLPPDTMASDPVLYTWGMSDGLLDLAECYIGLPVQYLGVSVKRECADGSAVSTRQWHQDLEDRRMLKLIIYLSDVDGGSGPFEYVEQRSSVEAVRRLRYSSGFVSDVQMAQLIPKDQWIRVTGPRLSAIFADPSRIFHRASPPTTTDRYSLTFSYLSTTPLQTFPEYTISPAALATFHDDLTPRQLRVAAVGN